MKDFTNNKATQNRGVGILERSASTARRVRADPVSATASVKPDGKASAISKGGVILRPVTDAVLGFGFFVLHKMRLPDLLHP
jgi:hypothetical protein